jgi:AbiJ N-terminal domain 4
MKFSERIGKTPVRTQLQVGSMDDALKTRLWNQISIDFFKPLNNYSTQTQNLCRAIWVDFFNRPMDEVMVENSHISEWGFLQNVKTWYWETDWFRIYDFIEYLAELSEEEIDIGFVHSCNLIFKNEVSGYRFIEDKIVQVNSEEEIQEIEEALTQTNKWNSVNTHLRLALEMVSDRKNPDYRNSIKESISAVESLCKIITNDDGITLGKALILIDDKFPMHTALKKAFVALYGYASDESGIRHSLDESGVNIRFEEAKFMLVACSAFINYLKNKIAI